MIANRIARYLLSARRLAREATADALAIAGAGCITFGAGLVYQPLWWIIGGAFLVVAGYIVSRELAP